MSELKPCPFCGGENILKQDRGYVGICCGLEGSIIAIDEWNTRPIEEALRAKITKLQAVVKLAANLPLNNLSYADFAELQRMAEELDVFQVLRVAWVDPQNRIGG